VLIVKSICGCLLLIFSLEIVSPVLTGLIHHDGSELPGQAPLTVAHELVSHLFSDESVDETRDRWILYSLSVDLPVHTLTGIQPVPFFGRPPLLLTQLPPLSRYALLQVFRI
jgi:hypothetical protein